MPSLTPLGAGPGSSAAARAHMIVQSAQEPPTHLGVALDVWLAGQFPLPAVGLSKLCSAQASRVKNYAWITTDEMVTLTWPKVVEYGPV